MRKPPWINRAWESTATGGAASITVFVLLALPLMLLNAFGIQQPMLVVWLAALLAGVITARYAWLTRLGNERHERGECRHCGYSLTGNASGVCPECGTKIAISNRN